MSCCQCHVVKLRPAPSLHLQGFEGLTQRIADYQAEKEARAAAVRAEEEARRLRECSFAPEINRQRVQAKVSALPGRSMRCWYQGLGWAQAWAVGGC